MPGFDIFYSLIILKSAAGKLPKRITVMPDSHIITRQVNSKLTIYIIKIMLFVDNPDLLILLSFGNISAIFYILDWG